MSLNYLYSIILELTATHDAALPAVMGHQTHALFLSLITQVDPVLARRLHDEPGYRPFTVSSLDGTRERDGTLLIKTGVVYRLHITLLDGGPLWQCLSSYFLENSAIILHLGKASFILQRILSTPSSDNSGWANYTDWQTLAATPARQPITMQFMSPTAFSIGDRHFALFPEPILLWDSLMRSWNLYAPEVLQIGKLALRESVKQHIVISDYNLHIETLRFPKYEQKGFIGYCTYIIKTAETYDAQLTALAEFASYAGVGYKTTMGMGQTRMKYSQKREQMNTNARGSAVSPLSSASRNPF